MNPITSKRTVVAVLSLAGIMSSSWVSAADSSSQRVREAVLEEVTVFGDPIGAPANAVTATEGVVVEQQIQLRPVARVAELLEFVPGLVATQHSGEGKANQYFLRGFNLDHGTDFAVRVDGLPVNMPTHAHGQGYTDLNFLIPELLSRLSYRKGPYYADSGDFSVAGSADFTYASSVDSGSLTMTAGSEDYYRLFAADSYDIAGGEALLGASSTRYAGPWDLDQDLRKYNGLFKYRRQGERSSWALTAMVYDNRWSATDQIPVRAVESGRIGRFGHIDPSDGGDSHRYSLSFDWERRMNAGSFGLDVYAIDYRLDLFSNFTYFLADVLRGDQFEQLDARRVYGFDAAYKTRATLFGLASEWALGVQGRHDDARVGLYQTERTRRFATTREDDVQETSLALYLSSGIRWHEKFRSVIAARLDRYQFDVEADLSVNSGSVSDTLVSPKVNLIAGPWNRTQYYLSVGRGFHSNDARGTTIRIDPVSGDAVDPVEPLSKALSVELGMRSDALADTQLAVTLFSLQLDSELVFVGDAGATEPLDETERYGIEVAAVYSPFDWLTIDGDFALTHARLKTAAGEQRIPQSVARAASCGLVVGEANKWSGGVRVRYLGAAPLIESNEVRSDSTLTVNLEASYAITPSWALEAAVYNAFGSRDSDITYFYASRLPGEDEAGVDDLHFHPVEPRALRLTIEHRFQ